MPTVASVARLSAHVDRIEQEHPPVPLDSVDYTVHRPELLDERYGHVLDYLARVELEVDRNVLELTAMLPDASAVDRRFYSEVWQPQEIHHGLILTSCRPSSDAHRRSPTPRPSRRRSASSAPIRRAHV